MATTAVWNTEVRDNFLRRKNAAKATIADNLSQMEQQLASIASATQGAQTTYDSKKPAIEQGVVTLRTLNSELERTLNAMDTSQLQFQIAAKKDEIGDVQTARDQKQTLADLRQEQSAALTAKYDSNYHSSWLGLWRPMSALSQYGLSFFAGLFGVIAVALLGFMGYMYYKGDGGAAAGGARNAAAAGNNFGLGAF